jgi:hypothetical protein
VKGSRANKVLTFVGHLHSAAKRMVHRGERRQAKREIREEWQENGDLIQGTQVTRLRNEKDGDSYNSSFRKETSC